MYHYIFDLDGTISNPEAGILNGYKFTFPKFNLPTPPDEELRLLIGPPLRRVFEDTYQLAPEVATEAIRTYRLYYNEMGGAYENNLYPGITELIQQLHQAQHRLHVATHKSAMAEKILDHFGLINYFSQIQYYHEEAGITTKERMIELILEKENFPDASRVVMIGDRFTDIEAAQHHGIRSVGVTYGFGSREELEQYQPDHIAEDVSSLHSILTQIPLS